MLEQKLTELTAAIVALTTVLSGATVNAPSELKKPSAVPPPAPAETAPAAPAAAASTGAASAPAASATPPVGDPFQPVKTALLAMAKAKGVEAVKELLKPFGVERAGLLKPDQYDAVLAAVAKVMG
jgi:hypothetical protein